MRDQQGLPGREAQDESLVPAAIEVVRQNSSDDAAAVDLAVALPGFAGLGQSCLNTGRLVDGAIAIIGVEQKDKANADDDDCGEDSIHGGGLATVSWLDGTFLAN